MKQILHIFQKDARHHWPEILVSLLLLAAYTRYQLHPWQPEFGPSFSVMHYFLSQYITPTMVIFWCFLIVRVIHDENLVGDRQWWVTKPYVWWELLAAKLLFIFIFVCVPLFHIQLFLLHQAGFPVFPHIWGILGMQFSIFLVLFFPALALGSLTKNIGQALLAVAGILLGFAGVAWLISRIPGSGVSSSGDAADALYSCLVFGSVVAASTWQFARRKTWYSRGLLVGAFAAAALVGAFTPYQSAFEREYPLAEPQAAPAKFAVLPPTRHTIKDSFDGDSEVLVTLLLQVSGIAKGSLVKLNALIVRSDSSNPGPATSGWKGEWMDLWPEGGQFYLNYRMDRQEYEKLKSAKIRIELAFTEFRETHARDTVVDPSTLSREGLGLCRIPSQNVSAIECLQALRAVPIIATFDPSKANCPLKRDDEANVSQDIAHYTNLGTDSLLEPKLNPVADFYMSFQTKPVIDIPSPGTPVPKRTIPQLCLGAPLHLAKPELTRRLRVKLDIGDLHLQDLVGVGQQ